MATSAVKFKFGRLAEYNALPAKDANALYFITDYGRIYRGEDLISEKNNEEQVIFTTTAPTAADAKEGVIYVVNDGASTGIFVKSGTEVAQVGGGTVQEGAITDLAAFESTLLDNSTGGLTNSDDKIPTSAAVAKAIESGLADYNGAIVDVSAARAADNSGTVLTFTPKQGEAKTVTVSDLFLTAASYDTNTHILSLTVRGQDTPVEVNLEQLVPQAVDTASVALARPITATVAVGNIKKGEKITVENTTDLQNLLEKMLSQDSNPTTVQPSAAITLTNAGAKEVGTKFTPSYTASLNPGSYSATAEGAQPTGVTATSYAVTDTAGHTASTASGSFAEITVEDSTNYGVSVSVAHSEGAVPKTFLGKDYPAGKIAAGTKTAASAKVTGYRNCFWGYKTGANKITATSITVAQIKALGNTNRNKPSSLAATNMQQMFFAVPASQASGLSIVGTNAPLPQTVLGPIKVQVGGVGDYAPIEYNVFYVDNATPASGSETYKLTWR